MIRSLRPGEPLPTGEPRRYRNAHGYIRLRWKIGKGQYVEGYEHRILMGARSGEHVHHRNRVRDDNAAANLTLISPTDHATHHHPRQIPVERARQMYEAGMTPDEIGAVLGFRGWPIARRLREAGVTMRGRHAGNRQDMPDGLIRELHARGETASGIARLLGVSDMPIRRSLREQGLHVRPGAPRGYVDVADLRGRIEGARGLLECLGYRIHDWPTEGYRRGFLVHSAEDLDMEPT